MAEFVAGSIEDCPVFNFDWVIKVAELVQVQVRRSPVFKVQDIPFQLACCFLGIYSGRLLPWSCHVDEPLSVGLLNLYLVGSDGSLKNFITLKNASFKIGRNAFSDEYELPGRIFLGGLDPKFLPNGELRIRCHLEIKTNEVVGAEPGVDGPVQDSALARELRNEVGTYELSDFKLVCEDREFPVYRLLLAARSSFFKAMFVGEWKEVKTGRAVLEDVDPQTLEVLLQYVHTDDISDDALTTELLALAVRYQIESLVKKCEDNLTKSLTCDNAVERFLVAYLHNANILKNAAKKFIVENFQHVKRQREFENIKKHHPEALFEILEYSCEN